MNENTEKKEELISKDTEFINKVLQLISMFSVPKDSENTFGGFNFRSAEDIIKHVKKPCIELGLYINVTKQVLKIESRYYTKAIAYITDGVNTIQSEAYAREPDILPKMSEPQVTGSAGSYAKKYALQDLLMIDDGNDDVDKNMDINEKELASGKDISKLKEVARKISELANCSPDNVLYTLTEKLNIKDISLLPKDLYSNAEYWLDTWFKNYTKQSNDKEKSTSKMTADDWVNQ